MTARYLSDRTPFRTTAPPPVPFYVAIPLPSEPLKDVDLPTLLQQYPVLEGLHPRARGPLLSAIHPARVSLTRHDLPVSAGMHEPEPGSPYTAAADLHASDLPDAQIRQILDHLGEAGFAAWYRIPGKDGWPSQERPHIHAVYAGVPMKPGLRAQVRDYLKGKNGLKSHRPYQYHRYSPRAVTMVKRLFNP